MIETDNTFQAECLKQISAFSKSEKEKIMKIDMEEWLNESRKLIPEIYNFKDGIIDKEYIKRSTPIAMKQIAKAGLRLTSVLNKYFKK